MTSIKCMHWFPVLYKHYFVTKVTFIIFQSTHVYKILGCFWYIINAVVSVGIITLSTFNLFLWTLSVLKLYFSVNYILHSSIIVILVSSILNLTMTYTDMIVMCQFLTKSGVQKGTTILALNQNLFWSDHVEFEQLEIYAYACIFCWHLVSFDKDKRLRIRTVWRPSYTSDFLLKQIGMKSQTHLET